MKRPMIVLSLLVLPALLACSAVSELFATPTPIPTATPTRTLTPTATSTPTPLPTETPDAAATQQYQDFFVLVQKQYDSKVIPSLDGTYTLLKDQTLEFAKNGSYQWDEYDYKIDNFILRADVTLETANRSSAASGCGFVFHTTSGTNAFVFLKQNGVASYGITGQEFTKKNYHSLSNPAQFKLELVVYHEKLRFLVDDKLILPYDDLVYVSNFKGGWGAAVLAGSSQDFGTRCVFKKFELWEVNE